MGLVATRPVPILAETVAVVAGTTGMSLRRAALAGALGNVVPAAVYAAVGAAAASSPSGTVVLAGVLAVAVLTWLVSAAPRRGPRDPGLSDREGASPAEAGRDC